MTTVINEVRPTVRTAGAVAGITALVGVVANLILFVIGELAGAELTVVAAGATTQIGVVQVVFASVVPLVAGFIALAIASRWAARGWTILAWLGLALGVLTAPNALFAQASAGTALVLGAMHVTIGATWFFLIRKSLQRNA